MLCQLMGGTVVSSVGIELFVGVLLKFSVSVGVLWLILSERVFILPCLVLFENEMLTRSMNLLVMYYNVVSKCVDPFMINEF